MDLDNFFTNIDNSKLTNIIGMSATGKTMLLNIIIKRYADNNEDIHFFHHNTIVEHYKSVSYYSMLYYDDIYDEIKKLHNCYIFMDDLNMTSFKSSLSNINFSRARELRNFCIKLNELKYKNNLTFVITNSVSSIGTHSEMYHAFDMVIGCERNKDSYSSPSCVAKILKSRYLSIHDQTVSFLNISLYLKKEKRKRKIKKLLEDI